MTLPPEDDESAEEPEEPFEVAFEPLEAVERASHPHEPPAEAMGILGEAWVGEEALAQVVRLRPPVVLLDAMMPRRDGFDVCRTIKNDPQLKGTYIIMLLAGRDNGNDTRCVDTALFTYELYFKGLFIPNAFVPDRFIRGRIQVFQDAWIPPASIMTGLAGPE